MTNQRTASSQELANAWRQQIVNALKSDNQGMNRLELRDAIDFPLGTKRLMEIVNCLVSEGVLDFSNTHMIIVADSNRRREFIRTQERNRVYEDFNFYYDESEVDRYQRINSFSATR